MISWSSLRYIRYYDAYYDDRKNSQVERGENVCSIAGFATHLLCSHVKTTCLIFLGPNFLICEREIL